MTSRLVAISMLALAACAAEDRAQYEVAGDALSIVNRAASRSDPYQIWFPWQRQNDPRAGDPGYVYLEIGKDGVALPGPTVAGLPAKDQDDMFKLEEPGMTWRVEDSGYTGLTVVVNKRLRYEFEIGDFENEVSVARVDLERKSDGLHSTFVLLADACNGVAFQATITVYVDGAAVGNPTAPWTIESRGPAQFGGCPW